MKQIGIFTGKQRTHNMQVLTLLYDNEPLSAWELTSKLTNHGKHSLHATLNKRLRKLELKGYVRREGRKWHLRFKGIIAVLLIQKTPKMWNPKWKEIFDQKAKTIEQHAAPLLKKLGIEKERLRPALQYIGLCLDNFDSWVNFSKKVKSLMDNGVINLDVIKEKTLLGIIIMETFTEDELSEIWFK
jgi:hypothetical protein